MTIIAYKEASEVTFVGDTLKDVLQEATDCGFSADEIAEFAFYQATEKKLVYTPAKFELAAKSK